MEAQQLAVKFYLEDGSTVRPHDFISVFHRWIQTRKLPDVMVDVAEYSHVHHGPGVLLICHSAHYSMDEMDGRLGLLYSHKRDGKGTFQERLRQAFRSALYVCNELEQEAALPSKIRFRSDEAYFSILNRLHAPNTAETFAKVQPELEALSKDLFEGSTVELRHLPDPKGPFSVRIQTAGGASNVSTLLGRLS